MRAAAIFKTAARWAALCALTGLLAGTASALLLVSLAWATGTREAHPWLIALLPLAGFGVGWLYLRFGDSVAKGNNLILDEIHAEVAADDTSPARVIPVRMTPLILAGTFLTHLFGGSAGREGTALQTGASLADQLARPFGLSQAARRTLLMAGISAGFSSVFGTPLAGAVFGIEVVAVGTLEWRAFVPCLVAAFIGDWTTRAWHVHHTLYRVQPFATLTLRSALWTVVAGLACGLVALLFARLTHALSSLFERVIAWPPFRPLAGGAIVAAAVFALHTTRYIGLGIPTILAAFNGPQPPWEWALKLVFTAVTLGAAFKGGEVTPLFFIGATFGNALAYLLPLPSSLLAGLGFAAVFAGAANTPIASTLMACELFGWHIGPYAAVACAASYFSSGHHGIYSAQRIRRTKFFRSRPA